MSRSSHPDCRATITSDSIDRPEVKAFIENPSEQALLYDLILTSPSLGTGIDITFEDQCQLIDVVYGFFDAMITTHFDFDQQLARVRHPGAVDVWVSPRWFRFDTAADVIKRDMLRSGMYNNLLVSIDENYRPVYLEDSPFLDMASLIVSQQRASKNNLKKNFIALKKRQGYTVNPIELDENTWLEGQNLARIGKRIAKGKRIKALLGAKTLKKSELDGIKDRLEENDEIGECERWSYQKTWIEMFYRKLITQSLIELDDEGKYGRRVTRFEAVLEKMKIARNVKLMMGSLESAVEIAGAAKLGPQLRFVKADKDITLTICYLLHKTPLMKEGVWMAPTLTTDDLQDFAHAMTKDKSTIENVLDIEVRADIRSKPMRQLNEVLKMIGLRCKPLKRNKTKQKMIYVYRLDQDLYDRMLRLVEKRRVTDGWRTLYEMHGWDARELDDDDGLADWNGTVRPVEREKATA